MTASWHEHRAQKLLHDITEENAHRGEKWMSAEQTIALAQAHATLALAKRLGELEIPEPGSGQPMMVMVPQ